MEIQEDKLQQRILKLRKKQHGRRNEKSNNNAHTSLAAYEQEEK